MDEAQYNRLASILERIAAALETLARAGAPAEPNYVKPLAEYRAFDWSSIEATVVQQDADGPTHLEWGGFLWTRRSPANKFDPAIWYSRAHGKDADGNNQYLRLISFKPLGDADRVPEKTAAQLAPEQALKPASSPTGSVNFARFLRAAIQEHGLSPQAAERIAAIAGVKLQNADHTLALAYLPFFGQAKRLGLDFAAARAILEEKIMDLDAALQVLEKQHTPPMSK